uniref:Uncharacterized protein n=1 Tax=viral metagenome TaxID=1070528 RepID=A0A6C0DRT8_9ZZZZ
MSGFISSAINNAVTPYFTTETFESPKGAAESKSESNKVALVSFLTLLVVLFLLLFVGKFLWNDVLIVLMPFIKPVKSVWQILGLALLISLMSPGC